VTNTGRSTVASTGAASACVSRPVAAGVAETARRRAAGIPARSASGAGPLAGANPETWSQTTDSKCVRRYCPSQHADSVSRRSACATATTASCSAAASTAGSPLARAASSDAGLTRLPWWSM
jgi:hypothetical protein